MEEGSRWIWQRTDCVCKFDRLINIVLRCAPEGSAPSIVTAIYIGGSQMPDDIAVIFRPAAKVLAFDVLLLVAISSGQVV